MAFSNKKIISFIENSKKSFDKKEIIEDIQKKSRVDRSRHPNRKKKNQSGLSQKDMEKLDNILNALLSIGYIKKERKKYKKFGNLRITGVLQINTSGHGVVPYDKQNAVIIRKKDLSIAQNGDNVLCRIVDFKKGIFHGEILEVIASERVNYAGRISSIQGGYYVISLLDTGSQAQACSEVQANGPGEDDFVIVKLIAGAVRGRPLCEILHHYSCNDEEFDFPRIRIKHNLPLDYSPSIIPVDSEDLVPKSELKNRKDYSRLYTITIDGEYSKDFDDAISIEKTSKSIKLYVHIADVSAYIKKGSDLDREALKRGTSYYIGNGVIPMLPEAISNYACSLRAGEKKLTLTTEITFDFNGNFKKMDVFRGMIKVNKRLTYEDAEKILNKRPLLKLAKVLHDMGDLADLLTQRRSSQGRLDLNLTDQEIIYDGNRVKEIKFARRLKSHILIEEFMLSANEAVSKLLKDKKIPTLYRIHEEIGDEKAKNLGIFFKTLGYTISQRGSMGEAIQKILRQVSGKSFEQVVSLVVLKSLMQAYYGPEPKGHFGLGFEDYTHFTSPIRRYPDLVVHRSLKQFLSGGKKGYNREELEAIGEETSTLERIAQRAERDMVKIKSCRIMKEKIGEEFDVLINGFSKFGIFVSLMDMPIEGMVPLRSMLDDYYVWKEDLFCVVGQRKKKKFQLGETMRVKLVAADIETIRIDFIPA